MAANRRLVAFLALFALFALVALTLPRAAAEPPAPGDWVLDEMKRRVVEDGVGWLGFGPGTVISMRTEQTGFGNSESRTTLVRREKDGLVFRYETRRGSDPWGKGVERKLPGGPVAGAESRVEDLGKESIEVDGKKVECAKARWTRVVAGTPTKPEFTVWTTPAGALARWSKDFGDGWVSTFTPLRADVEWRLGDQVFRCREVREVAVSSTMGATFDRTSLWAREVPDHMVRQTSSMTMGPSGPAQTQTSELTMFGATPDAVAPDTTTPAAPTKAGTK